MIKRYISSKKYEELNEEYQKLKENYDKLFDRNCEIIKSLNNETDHCNRINSRLATICDVNKVNADVIQFLAARKFGDDPTIEFAAVKTYRGGWVTLYLNGEELNPNGKDVTIWADRDEPVRIEVSNS